MYFHNDRDFYFKKFVSFGKKKSFFFGSKPPFKVELPTYLANAAGTEETLSPLEWWKVNSLPLSHWSEGLLIQPSSAASERVFLLLKVILMNSNMTVYKTTYSRVAYVLNCGIS